LTDTQGTDAPAPRAFRKPVAALPTRETSEAVARLTASSPGCRETITPILPVACDGASVEDAAGNRWLDFASVMPFQKIPPPAGGPAMRGAAAKAELAARLLRGAPAKDPRIFFASPPDGAIEIALQIALEHGRRVGGKRKVKIASIGSGLRGMGLGARMSCGLAGLGPDVEALKLFIQAPYPDGWQNEDPGLDSLQAALDAAGASGHDLCAVAVEAVSSNLGAMLPLAYARTLSAWCGKHKALLILDEAPLGLGRTGAFFSAEAIGIEPDILCVTDAGFCGSTFSAAICSARALEVSEFVPGWAPMMGECVAWETALARAAWLQADDALKHIAAAGGHLQAWLAHLGAKFPRLIGRAAGCGMIGSLLFALPGVKDPDPVAADAVVKNCLAQGLLLNPTIAPATVRVQPLLTAPEEALTDGIEAIEQVLVALDR